MFSSDQIFLEKTQKNIYITITVKNNKKIEQKNQKIK